MTTVRFSKGEDLILPESLGRALGLHEGDHVDVQRQGSTLWVQHRDVVHSPGPLTDLARIVSSSRPVGSVNVKVYTDKRGYE